MDKLKNIHITQISTHPILQNKNKNKPRSPTPYPKEHRQGLTNSMKETFSSIFGGIIANIVELEDKNKLIHKSNYANK